MHNRHDPRVLPMRDGVNPSCVVLPSIVHGLLLDFLVQRLPAVSRADWLRRLGAGEVVDEQGVAATAQSPCTPGLRYYYYRELPSETPIPFEETVLYQDEHILVADKPHFLPVVPAGRYLQQTLLVRLKRRLGLPELSPVHRIDRDTAGLVLFSVQRATRGMYQALFRERAVRKVYEAVAPWRADLPLPRVHESRLEELGHFFRMQEVPGTPNAITAMAVVEQEGPWARYRLEPITGKRHQLRVHMAALGLPLCGDGFYPEVNDPPEGDYSNPLQLLARTLSFTDPVTGQARDFASRLQLRALASLG
ncbi:MAG TPA: pseudouridine synthase [Alicycliphilus sp.]|jgi:tRNA pseudouridine32 synthase/23S rRNA pseudouridine746 synthase|uniref:Pseudouridine synthase n=1 Tax=Diaphorobacter limosus TaxID=3036128 RepID=A0ABZ0J6M9_9BURK|nr:pseudouridine synthase [Diaphorobacter sp. Y-1]MBP6752250.1 pseudouridine synthase [Alicycliphilus sp.]MBP7324761.1 pseudouridine synthase [Alicycliphilus sp.]MBP7329705.1 pseudouridine synthase [Alicycliphilus sp.]MBP8779059.1 pseudouridine synthase [Alicycliphilus sp.]TXJ09738.1 MAG: pseudouridine synthase [Alicycliphilus sp.]